MGILKIMHSFWESKKSKPKKQTNKKAPFRNFVTQGTKKKRILLWVECIPPKSICSNPKPQCHGVFGS